MDDNNHGTHVAGTIGAVGDNGQGVAGVNWKASLMGLKFQRADGLGTVADAINAIEFAVRVKKAFAATNGADVRVLNNSWGGEVRSV
ncbi:MAG: S8 family serine peptidase [Pyrinomonadaceae bacterium]